MEVRDYNGQGKWTGDEIIKRYFVYCNDLNILEPLDLLLSTFTENDVQWIQPVMYKVIHGIEKGDEACKLIGIEFIEEDHKSAFNRVIKVDTLRALRRAKLDEKDKDRIRSRLIDLILASRIPHQYREYANLLKKVGFGDRLEEIREKANKDNPTIMKVIRSLMTN
jgi:hypothetical protein